MTRPHPSSPLAGPVSKVAVASLVLALLSACASSSQWPETAIARTETSQWADRVHVDARPDEVLLAPHAEGLSVAQTQALDGLTTRWLAAEAREIVVSAPVGGAGGEVAGRMAVAARQHL